MSNNNVARFKSENHYYNNTYQKKPHHELLRLAIEKLSAAMTLVNTAEVIQSELGLRGFCFRIDNDIWHRIYKQREELEKLLKKPIPHES